MVLVVLTPSTDMSVGVRFLQPSTNEAVSLSQDEQLDTQAGDGGEPLFLQDPP